MFTFYITSDSNWDARINYVQDYLQEKKYRQFFEGKSYGNDLAGISIVLMCRNPEYNFKQRIRFDKNEKKIRFDIMLDYNQFVVIKQEKRNHIVVQKLLNEVPQIITKYKLKDFDLSAFTKDLQKVFND